MIKNRNQCGLSLSNNNPLFQVYKVISDLKSNTPPNLTVKWGAFPKSCLTRWVEWRSGVERASCPLQFPGGLSQPWGAGKSGGARGEFNS